MAGTTLSGSGDFPVLQGYYASNSLTNANQILPIGIAGFNNNSNSSNCYLEFAGYFASNSSVSVAPGHTITTTVSTFALSFFVNGAGTGSPLTASNTSGNPAMMYLTSFNGEAGGITTGVSDTFYFPSSYIGNNQNRIFLDMNIVDSATQSTGFHVTSATAYFF